MPPKMPPFNPNEAVVSMRAKQQEQKERKKSHGDVIQISPERFDEIDAIVSNKPEIFNEAQHAHNMARLFGEELHQYYLEKEARELGISKPIQVSELTHDRVQEEKENKKEDPEQLSLI